MKKRFYVYNSWKEQMELLSTEEKATMLMNLFAYQNDEEVVLDTPMLKMCWASMKFLLEKDAKEYNDRVERGRKAGKSNRKASNDTITALNGAVRNNRDNDNVNVNVNDNDDDNVVVNVNGKVDDDGDDKDKEWFLERLTNGASFKDLNTLYPQSSSLREALNEWVR